MGLLKDEQLKQTSLLLDPRTPFETQSVLSWLVTVKMGSLLRNDKTYFVVFRRLCEKVTEVDR